MKHILAIFITLALVIWFSGCSEDNSSGTDQLVEVLIQGTWKVTYYMDSDTLKTDHYNGYSFSFTSSSVLLAEKGTETTVGYWAPVEDGEDTKLVISFSSPAELLKISDDWVVLESAETVVRLVIVSNSGNSPDYLTFEKE